MDDNKNCYDGDKAGLSAAAFFCKHKLETCDSDGESGESDTSSENEKASKLSSPTEYVQDIQESEMPDYNDPDV